MCLAVPGRILEIEGDNPLARSARVSFGGVVKQINLAYVPEAKVDDFVIVHVGFALNVVDEGAAQRILQEFEAAGIDPLDPAGLGAAVPGPSDDGAGGASGEATP